MEYLENDANLQDIEDGVIAKREARESLEQWEKDVLLNYLRNHRKSLQEARRRATEEAEMDGEVLPF